MFLWVWMHRRTEKTYIIERVSRWSGGDEHADLAPMITYRSVGDGRAYTQPAARFFSPGRFVAHLGLSSRDKVIAYAR
jgi:hypothetical protein